MEMFSSTHLLFAITMWFSRASFISASNVGCMNKEQLQPISSNNPQQLSDIVTANSIRREGVDSALAKYAGLALGVHGAKTGNIYNVTLPPSLSGIQCQAVRLRTGSFRRRGFSFHQFPIPNSYLPFINSTNTSQPPFIVFVYRSFVNFTVYTLPSNYKFAGPPIGIIAYSAYSNSTFAVTDELSLALTATINFTLPAFDYPKASTKISSSTFPVLCAFFSTNGSIFVSNLTSHPNHCSSSSLGDFALISRKEPVASYPPVQSPTPATTLFSYVPRIGTSSMMRNWKLVLGIACVSIAGFCLFALASFLVCVKLSRGIKHYYYKKPHSSRYELFDILEASPVGGSRTPTAAALRTKPILEVAATNMF